MADPTYEERFGPVERRIRRVVRRVRWACKGVLRASRDVLVEVRWRLGDEVMAIPVYQALKEQNPDCRVTVWCSYPDLLVDNPYVDAINAEAVSPDRYVLLRGAPRDVYRIAHYARRAGVPAPSYLPRLHYEDWSAPVLEGLADSSAQLVAVCTGASWPTKRWPADRWRTVCSALPESGHRVVQLGHDDEVIGAGTNLVGRTSVRDAACVLRAANVLVCCDSGLMHLALAVGTPVVALFGPTEPSILVRDNPALVTVETGRDCRGCWNISQGHFANASSQEMKEEGVCPLDETTCLEDVTPEMVLARVDECLARGT